MIVLGLFEAKEKNMNTQDLSSFGYRELDMAGDLLKTYKQTSTSTNVKWKGIDKTRFFGEGVSVEFNPNSGNVFLVDEDYNVALMNGDNLEDFFSCPICGHEGFLEDMGHDKDNGECQEYLKDIGYEE